MDRTLQSYGNGMEPTDAWPDEPVGGITEPTDAWPDEPVGGLTG